MPNETKSTDNQPIAKAAMLIRKPVAEVFEAFVNPDITSKFWFSRGIGRLDSGAAVEWFWDQYKVSAKVTPHQILKDQFIAFTWLSPDVITTVEISFKPYGGHFTFISITEKGWDINREGLFELLAGQTEGWTLVLTSLKALFEHNIKLGVIADRHPDLSMPELKTQ